MTIFGVNPLGLRLPSILEFFAGSLAIFFYMRRKVGDRYAAVAVLMLWASGTFFYAIEARPYALMFMCFSFLLLCWDGAATDRTRHCVALGRRHLELRLAQRSCFCAARALPVSCSRMRALPQQAETGLSVVGRAASARGGDGDLSSTYQQLPKNADIPLRGSRRPFRKWGVLLWRFRHQSRVSHSGLRAPRRRRFYRRAMCGRSFSLRRVLPEKTLFRCPDTQSAFLESGIDAAARCRFSIGIALPPKWQSIWL